MAGYTIPVAERCSCGATFSGTFPWPSDARAALEAWREGHLHEVPPPPVAERRIVKKIGLRGRAR